MSHRMYFYCGPFPIVSTRQQLYILPGAVVVGLAVDIKVGAKDVVPVGAVVPVEAVAPVEAVVAVAVVAVAVALFKNVEYELFMACNQLGHHSLHLFWLSINKSLHTVLSS
jgi:hypothetical protein